MFSDPRRPPQISVASLAPDNPRRVPRSMTEADDDAGGAKLAHLARELLAQVEARGRIDASALRPGSAGEFVWRPSGIEVSGAPQRPPEMSIGHPAPRLPARLVPAPALGQCTTDA